MNTISENQNKPENINLLRAQRRYYSRAKLYQGCLYAASLILAVGSTFVPPDNTKLQAYMPLLALLFLLVDLLIVSPYIKDCKERAAKCQELFDTKVLSLPHNTLIAGSPIELDLVYAITADERPRKGEDKLSDWYVGDFRELPITAARIVCQRMNVSYDKSVRKTYMVTLIVVLVVLAVALLIFGICRELTLNELVFTWAAPLIPLVTLVVREAKSHWDVMAPLKALDAEISSLLREAQRSPADEGLTARSRQVQDAIYQRRETNPLVSDRWYEYVRNKQEKIANRIVEQTVKDFKSDKE